jgi:hypothetical protein
MIGAIFGAALERLINNSKLKELIKNRHIVQTGRIKKQ